MMSYAAELSPAGTFGVGSAGCHELLAGGLGEHGKRVVTSLSPAGSRPGLVSSRVGPYRSGVVREGAFEAAHGGELSGIRRDFVVGGVKR